MKVANTSNSDKALLGICGRQHRAFPRSFTSLQVAKNGVVTLRQDLLTSVLLAHRPISCRAASDVKPSPLALTRVLGAGRSGLMPWLALPHALLKPNPCATGEHLEGRHDAVRACRVVMAAVDPSEENVWSCME